MTTNDERICREQAIAVLDKLIEYHTDNIHFCIQTRWLVDEHHAAAETLKKIRDHLDRCYEIRSCD